MSRAYPYRRPPADTVRPEPWISIVPDGAVPLPEALDDWDYNTCLELRRTLWVDGARIRSSIGVPDDTPLTLSVRWTASGSLLRGCAVRESLDCRDGVRIDLAPTLPGGDLGGTLKLETLICLGAEVPGGSTADRSPTRPGSILWSDEAAVRLQGSASMFPVVVEDLAALGHRADAAWYLEVSEDLNAQAMGSLLLIVNSRNALLVDALNAPAGDARAAMVRSSLRSGVAVGLVEHALATDGFEPSKAYDEGTLGAVLGGVIRQLSLDREWLSLRQMRTAEPALFTELMQHATRLWDTP